MESLLLHRCLQFLRLDTYRIFFCAFLTFPQLRSCFTGTRKSDLFLVISAAYCISSTPFFSWHCSLLPFRKFLPPSSCGFHLIRTFQDRNILWSKKTTPTCRKSLPAQVISARDGLWCLLSLGFCIFLVTNMCQKAKRSTRILQVMFVMTIMKIIGAYLFYLQILVIFYFIFLPYFIF